MIKQILAILVCTLPFTVKAQEKWGLRKCVDYALKNNITIKQADVQARVAALMLKQSKFNQIPTASFSSGVGVQFGRSIDPTSNQFTTTQFLSQNFSLQGGAEIFNFGRLRNAAAAAGFSAQAALTDVARAQNDISLNVASYYLQVLAAKQQIDISEIQLQQTMAQLEDTKKRVEAGALPELNQAELESQLATDSSNLITAKSTFQQNVLFLKALLNIDAASPFEVDTPPVEQIPVESFADLQPDVVYELASGSQPLQKEDSLKILAQQKSILSSKASMYPSLSGFYSLGSAFNNQAQEVIGSTIINNPPIGKVNVGGTDYNVVSNQAFVENTYGKTKYFNQLNHNFNQAVGLSISIPIFNNGTARNNYQRSKLSLESLQLQKQQDDQTLKSNIYTAYSNSVAAFEKYNASIKSVMAAQKTYDFASERYKVGLLSTFELITDQNNLLTAKLQLLANHYDYVFKMKVLEFYKGQGIKL